MHLGIGKTSTNLSIKGKKFLGVEYSGKFVDGSGDDLFEFADFHRLIRCDGFNR